MTEVTDRTDVEGVPGRSGVPGTAGGRLSPQAAELTRGLDACLSQLRAAQEEVRRFAASCADLGLPVDPGVTGCLLDAARRAERRVADEPVGPDLSAGEAVLRFGLSTVAYVRGALEWCAQSYDQSRAVQFFDPRAQNSPTVNYERYGHPAVDRVDSQLHEVFGLSDRLAATTTSSGMAAFSVIESFLVRDRLRPGDVVLLAPYVYFESDEQLAALPFVRLERARAYEAAGIVDDVRRLRPKVLFVDRIANTAEQRVVDLHALLTGLRQVLTERLTVVIDGTMASATLPPALLESDDLVEVLYYESCSKYLQLGLDSGMAGVVVHPAELTERVLRLRRNAGAVLYRHSAELFPRYDRDLLRARVRRICANATALATLLHADPRTARSGALFHPSLPDHPDRLLVQGSDCVTGFATFLFHDATRNTKKGLDEVIDRILVHARAAGVQLTKGASFGFSVPRASAADAMAPGRPPFLRLYAGDREAEVPALAEVVARGLEDG
ncbi:PLP-dependent transferase [Actinosynnema sp. NPDC050801]|uniref:PLP-dependent transferase n=1 Tax=unclassified Actinosynnema TaxID=2637065 RepID=UPI0033C29935